MPNKGSMRYVVLAESKSWHSLRALMREGKT